MEWNVFSKHFVFSTKTLNINCLVVLVWKRWPDLSSVFFHISVVWRWKITSQTPVWVWRLYSIRVLVLNINKNRHSFSLWYYFYALKIWRGEIKVIMIKEIQNLGQPAQLGHSVKCNHFSLFCVYNNLNVNCYTRIYHFFCYISHLIQIMLPYFTPTMRTIVKSKDR